MDFKLVILERAVKWLVSGELFDAIQDIVVTIQDSQLSSEEKRAYALKRGKELFADAATVFINLAIEVAVILMKAELSKVK